MPAAASRFDVLDTVLLRAIAEQGGIRRFPANAVLINEGDVADTLYIVLEGRLKVYSTNEEGKAVVIAVHGPGESVSELSLDGGVRSASVMTLEPTTCSIVSGADLRGFIAAHPDFALHLIGKLIRRVRHATDRVKSLALDDVYERVVRVLNDASDESVGAGGERIVRERLTQQDIAERVGASREMVSRIFKDLAQGGYVAVKASRITLLKRLPAHW